MKMQRIALAAVVAAAAVTWMTAVPLVGQTSTTAAAQWTTPRTPDGQPDLQGIWTYKNITPLERPSTLAGKAVLTEQEAEEFAQAENRRQNRDLIDPAKGGAGIYPAGGVIPYNEFWYDRGSTVTGSRRTSLIIDPPDGRLPPMTAEGQKRAEARAAEQREAQAGRPKADSHLDRPLAERCIQMGSPVPMMSGAYNNNVRIVQAPGYVMLLNEMIHDNRIIPLDGRPHVPAGIRQLLGDSRGRWEGDTLIVETRNFTDKTRFRGSTEGLVLTERFRRLGPDMLGYEFTVNDPATWTRPWTAAFEMSQVQEEIYEYACHEGNHGLLGVLAGARVADRTGANRDSR